MLHTSIEISINVHVYFKQSYQTYFTYTMVSTVSMNYQDLSFDFLYAKLPDFFCKKQKGIFVTEATGAMNSMRGAIFFLKK